MSNAITRAVSTDFNGDETCTVAEATNTIQLWISLGEQGDSSDPETAAAVKAYVTKHSLAKAVIAYRAAWEEAFRDEYGTEE